jgi:hypothetical protein
MNQPSILPTNRPIPNFSPPKTRAKRGKETLNHNLKRILGRHRARRRRKSNILVAAARHEFVKTT